MILLKTSTAGTLESSDIQIFIKPMSSGGIDIDLESDVYDQYGEEIIRIIEKILKKYNITNLKIRAIDKGARNHVIIARLTAALFRASDEKYNWEEGDKIE